MKLATELRGKCQASDVQTDDMKSILYLERVWNGNWKLTYPGIAKLYLCNESGGLPHS